MARSANHLDRLAVLGAALLFSTGGAVIKATTLSGFQVAGARSGLAAIVLALLLPRWRAFWRPRALLVGLAYGATLVLYTVANKLTTAANAIFLQSTAPLYVLALGPWLLQERNRRSDVALTSVLLLGMVLFFLGSEAPVATATDPDLGNAVAAASGLSWAFTLVGLRWMARRDRSGTPHRGKAAEAGAAVVAGNLLAFAFCLPFSTPLVAPRLLDGLLVGYLGVFQIGLAYVLMTRGLARVPALEASLILLLEPVANALFAWGVHGERPGPFALAGCAVILTATAARTLLAARQLPQPPEGGGDLS